MFRDYECSNCNVYGHGYSHCPNAIVSYGIILYDELNDKYLMIRRKDSFGFIDFVKGKYSLSNLFHIKNSIEQMSQQEKLKIVENLNNFESLWKSLYADNETRSNNFYNSQKKFEALKRGIHINNKFYTLSRLMKESTTSWNETEWEFPKGRKLKGEPDIDCALREFEEETGYLKDSIQIVENIIPFEEIFIGSNHRPYKHKYFLAFKKDDGDYNISKYQRSEVSKIEWKHFDDCLQSIRNYNMEKKNILLRVQETIKKSCII